MHISGIYCVEVYNNIPSYFQKTKKMQEFFLLNIPAKICQAPWLKCLPSLLRGNSRVTLSAAFGKVKILLDFLYARPTWKDRHVNAETCKDRDLQDVRIEMGEAWGGICLFFVVRHPLEGCFRK